MQSTGLGQKVIVSNKLDMSKIVDIPGPGLGPKVQRSKKIIFVLMVQIRYFYFIFEHCLTLKKTL